MPVPQKHQCRTPTVPRPQHRHAGRKPFADFAWCPVAEYRPRIDPELRAEAERRSAQAADRRSGAITAGVHVTAASLRADLANARAANHRQYTELEALRRRLGQILGRQVLADLGDTPVTNPTDPRVEQLDKTLSETKEELAQCQQELAAARQINRELIARINRDRR